MGFVFLFSPPQYAWWRPGPWETSHRNAAGRGIAPTHFHGCHMQRLQRGSKERGFEPAAECSRADTPPVSYTHLTLPTILLV